uniref:Putative Endoribonuclease L-PSP n=1 Tax=Moniliophthora roreri TaxID=221103 RepID=A0A0W0G4N7_MONRR
MSTKKIVSTPEANPVLAVFSQAVISKGYVYVSGNIGCDKNFKVVEGGVKAQTRAALENVAIVLRAAGSGLEHIVKATIYLTNMERDFGPMNEVYAEVDSSTKIECQREHVLASARYLWVLALRLNAWRRS